MPPDLLLTSAQVVVERGWPNPVADGLGHSTRSTLVVKCWSAVDCSYSERITVRHTRSSMSAQLRSSSSPNVLAGVSQYDSTLSCTISRRSTPGKKSSPCQST